jgi:hypothetical protein
MNWPYDPYSRKNAAYEWVIQLIYGYGLYGSFLLLSPLWKDD